MGRLVNTADINNVLMSEKSNYGVFAVEIDRIISGIVSKCPTIEQEPKTGHWIDADGDNAICGCCNRLNHLYGTYCKHCGAKMNEPRESEDV